ncbi:MAG: hypothetical protein ACYTJ0_06525, partial [Planctomycetota bacterium]
MSDRAEIIRASIHCTRCGYLLRGLREDAACPECGQAIAESLAGAWLAVADPHWRRRVAIALLAAAVLSLVLLLLQPPLVMWIWRLSGWSWMNLTYQTMAAAQLLAPACLLVAAAREPG